MVRHRESALPQAPRSAARTFCGARRLPWPGAAFQEVLITAFTVIPTSPCVLMTPGARPVIRCVTRRAARLLPMRAASLFVSGPPRRQGGQPEGGWTAQVVGGHESGPGASGGHRFLRRVRTCTPSRFALRRAAPHGTRALFPGEPFSRQLLRPGLSRGPATILHLGQRWRCLSLRFLIRLPQVAMSHQAPARLWERS